MNPEVEPFDVLLVFALAILAWQALRASDLFTGIVQFMLFGLLTSLAWVRLNAPDIALAEAAIGAGITGALFLGALGRMEEHDPNVALTERIGAGTQSPPAHALLLVGLSLLAVVLCLTALDVPLVAAGLAEPVQASLGQTGVENPVTAVILNYRGYDTLLEMGVLLLAALAVFALHASDPSPRPHGLAEVGPMFIGFLQFLAPILIVTSGYLLWAGASEPGGAFQAGAVLAAVGVGMLLAGARISFGIEMPLRRGLAAMGFLLFLLVALGVAGSSRHVLEYPPEKAKYLILAIELSATVSIAFTLAALFAGCSALLGRASGTGPPLAGEER